MPSFASLMLFAAAIGQFAPGAGNLNTQGPQTPPVAVNQDTPPANASWLPPELVIVAEKVPYELPDGQSLMLLDHKVGHDRIRYAVGGVEYKPRVGEPVALRGPDYVILVTCTRWKLLKKDYGRDSAEFQIECISQLAPPAPADSAPRSPAPVAPHVAPAPTPRPGRQSGERPLPPRENNAPAPEPRAAAPTVLPASAAQPPRPAVAQPQSRPQAAGEPQALPGPFSVILAEKRPFRLPNGMFLILKDHKVGHDQVRYEVDGIQYKPAVGETLAFPGPGFDVYVTCTHWKLLKKYYGEDSAEFLIESFPAP